ncbi:MULTISPECIES: phage tail protein [unclassified Acinetobacter]|uniref:phage tail protein n=1 Tax=unclassified Acinetobacter TaxID=196816 RepID=UPI0022AC8081|nr:MULTISPECIES: phage tail protein [unclassified Acinetobacter]WAU72963.1 phage tail protein [Acinetobacter sp. TR11]WAU76057.1 phage tail protein [Acinetobacter sp. TR3]
MLMALGQFLFTTDVLSFDALQRQRQWKYASNQVARGRDAVQFMGVGDDVVTLKGKIYEEHGFGKRQSIDELAAMADQGHGYVLIDGSGYIYGVYKIDSIDEDKDTFIDVGVSRKIDFSIKLTHTDDQP